ncbi:MAG: hypothetical protein R3264_15940, partial [Anaerolineae bacterium]|nr:hypothetical protein [Anaerolineae bacterium]
MMTTAHPRFPETDIVMIIKNPHRAGSLGRLLTVLGEEGALVGDIETQFIGTDYSFREVTVSVYDAAHLEQIKQAIEDRTKAEVLEIKDLVFERHTGGKIHSSRRQSLECLEDLRY